MAQAIEFSLCLLTEHRRN